MSIIELLQHVGAENIQLQNLADSLVKADMKKHDGEITFATDRSIVHDMALNRCDKVGLILWLPKDKMPDAKSSQNATPHLRGGAPAEPRNGVGACCAKD